MRDPSQTESNVMHENPKLTIAIDGPSGSGKSSVSKEVARHFGLAYLDTGAMYRAATYRVLQLDIDLADQDAIGKAVQEMPLVFGTNIKEEEILMGTTDIREEIRTERISGAVSAVASVPAVREYLNAGRSTRRSTVLWRRAEILQPWWHRMQMHAYC